MASAVRLSSCAWRICSFNIRMPSWSCSFDKPPRISECSDMDNFLSGCGVSSILLRKKDASLFLLDFFDALGVMFSLFGCEAWRTAGNNNIVPCERRIVCVPIRVLVIGRRPIPVMVDRNGAARGVVASHELELRDTNGKHGWLSLRMEGCFNFFLSFF